jgi:CheY-like chemotaxis protein
MAMTDGTVRVLVAEDDAEIRQTLRLIVEDGGYEVLEARDGVAALEVLRASQAALVVLLDLMMPRLDGAGVLQAISDDAVVRGRHEFIVVTAGNRTLPLSAAQLISKLSAGILPKPFEMDDLLKAVDEAAQRLRERGS